MPFIWLRRNAYASIWYRKNQILSLSLGDRNFSLISITQASTPCVSLSTLGLGSELKWTEKLIPDFFQPDPLELKGHEINRIALNPIHKQMQSKVSSQTLFLKNPQTVQSCSPIKNPNSFRKSIKLWNQYFHIKLKNKFICSLNVKTACGIILQIEKVN
jgi:hypothetical protein